MKYLFTFLFAITFSGCAFNQLQTTQSATILLKTPKMKFYDRGFIYKYGNYTQVEIYGAGQVVLDLKLYDNRVCQSTFKCMSSKSFNKEYLSSTYEDNFLKELFDKDEKSIYFKDKNRGILIKIDK